MKTDARLLRLVALISGGGTTLQNLLYREYAGTLAGTVVGVIASRDDARGVQRAREAGLEVRVISKGEPQDELWSAIREFEPNLVCLAGWLHLLRIPPDFERRVLNIHPSLLPLHGGKGMYGRHVHEAVLAAGETVTGCTVHYADNSYDTGPIVLQRQVPVLPRDTAVTLAARVYEAECEAYPEAIALIAAQRESDPAFGGS